MDFILNFFEFKNQKLNLSLKTYVMGILNITPDSFSDGGKYVSKEQIIQRAKQIESEGADILDIGAQSTRPGFKPVPPKIEWKRLEPVLKDIRKNINIPISIDTFYPQVAENCLRYGIDIINDISGCSDVRMFGLAKKFGCGIIINHNYNNLNIKPFFEKKLMQAQKFEIPFSRVCFDPGIGFNKNQSQDRFILNNINKIKIEGNAILIGLSRKRIVGIGCNNPPPYDRLAGTIAANTLAIINGANIIRVHDVKEAVQASSVTDYLIKQK